MATAEFKNGPNLAGWAIGVAAGLVALGVLLVVGKLALMPGAFIAALVALGVGVVLGMPWGADAGHATASSPKVSPRAPVATPAPAPVSAESAQPASFVGQPLAASEPASGQAPMSESETAAASLPAEAATAAPFAAMPEAGAGTEPLRLSAPRNGVADNLKEIEGIGPALEKLCNELGFYHFDQIATWTDADVAWVDHNMARFKGRIVRDKWVSQAKIIVTEGLEAFRLRAQTNDY